MFISKVPDLGDGRGARGLLVYPSRLLPEWTTRALLIAMCLYDLAAVLLPSGPLRHLVELAITRDVCEARRAEPSGGGKEAVERKEGYRY